MAYKGIELNSKDLVSGDGVVDISNPLKLGSAWKNLGGRVFTASSKESFQFQGYRHPPHGLFALGRCGIEMF